MLDRVNKAQLDQLDPQEQMVDKVHPANLVLREVLESLVHQ